MERSVDAVALASYRFVLSIHRITLRSEKFRHLIATLPCMCCGKEGQNQAAPANFQSFGKWMGIKASDAALMALCVRCHAELDQGQTMMKEERRNAQYEWIAIRLIIQACAG